MDHPISTPLFIELIEFRINSVLHRAAMYKKINRIDDETVKRYAIEKLEIALNKIDNRKLDAIYYRYRDPTNSL